MKCLGRRPAVHNLRTMRAGWAMLQALDPPGPAPAVSDNYVAAEAHAEVWPGFVTAGGTAPNGFDLPSLLEDLQVVAAS